MAMFNYPLRRMLVAAAFLMLCVVDVALVHADDAPKTVANPTTTAFLDAFKKANTGNLDTSLMDGEDYCKWKFVECKEEGDAQNKKNTPTGFDFGRVDDKKKITGAIVLPDLPKDVKDWSGLTIVSIKAGGLEKGVNGSLPESWGALTKLTTLNLNGDKIAGPVPASWGSFTSTTSLDLTSNSMCGCLPESWMKEGNKVPKDNFKVDDKMYDVNCSKGNHACTKPNPSVAAGMPSLVAAAVSAAAVCVSAVLLSL